MLLKYMLGLDYKKDKEYKVKAMNNSIIYAKITGSQLLKLYYLISYKDYPKK